MDDKPTTLTRREALRGAAVLFGTISAGSVLATLAPSRAWALELGALSQPAKRTNVVSPAANERERKVL